MPRLAARALLFALLTGLLVLPAFAGGDRGARLGTAEGRLIDMHGDVPAGEPVPGFGLQTGTRSIVLAPDQPRELVGQQVRVEDSSNLAGFQGQATAVDEVRVAAAPPAGPRTVAVVLVNFSDDTSQPLSVATIRSRVFTGSGSVNQFYQEQSGGQSSLAGIADAANGDVFGWWTLAMARPTNCTNQAMFNIAAGAVAQASAHGVDLSAYQSVVFYFTRNTACAWAGLAEQPGSRAWINGSNTTSVIAHEIGHNMGVAHAASLSCGAVALKSDESQCTFSDYGDPNDVMGLSQNLMGAWHRAQLGQLPAAARNTATVTGQYAIADANDSAAPGQRLLLIPRQAGGGAASEYFAVDLRSRSGAFDTFSPAAPQVTGVTIRLVPLLSTISESMLIDNHPATSTMSDAPLQPGETFSDPASGVTIRNVATAPGSATVAVTFPAGSDTEPPSAPALSATLAPGSGRVDLAWTAASDNSGVDHYEVRRDGVAIATTPAALRTFSDGDLTGRQTATYTVAAFDAAGNSTASSPATVQIPDLTPPQLVTVTGTRLAFGAVRLDFSATDDRGVAGYTVAWDGGSITTTATGFTHTAAPLSAISYTITAQDAAGNVSAPVAVLVPAGERAAQPGSPAQPGNPAQPDPGSARRTRTAGTPRIYVSRGRSRRLTVAIAGASRIRVRSGSWSRSAAGARLAAVVPRQLDTRRSVRITVSATVSGRPVIGSFGLRRGRLAP